ncbi:hypothetical protein QWY85_18615 [Neolewinella lacunae]|uniref:Hyaluronidase n=1 Tax=Neolewinella lacunae TaxID=1517758 RepID=A0A923PHD9_9BACT|nr:hypothetical protein [Neolewinella lacunae]MBC6994163.1 hypothetical protein [Neolewinella lacunae]MDN3636688.1 hypothetical protein [Neolewinella lacunae]
MQVNRYKRQILVASSIIFLLVLCSCTTPRKVLRVNGVEVYQSLGGVGQAAQDTFSSLGVGEILLVNGKHVHTQDGLFLDSVGLAVHIVEQLPNKKSRAMVVLDWEGERMQQIFEGAMGQTTDYWQAKEQMMRAYHLVKKLRPKTTVGFYGFPARDYWNRNDDWRARNLALAPFLREVDAIFPSLYDFYPTTDKNREMELGYVKDNVTEALRLGSQLKKPVFPFVWHRYHDSNKEVGRTLIPPGEFGELLRTTVTTKWAGHKIDGLIWWSSERYFYNLEKKREGSTEDFERLNSPVTQAYLRTLLNALANE